MRHISGTDLASCGKQTRIPQGIKSITPWLFWQPQHIQSISHHRSPTQRMAEKSTWWGMERNSRRRRLWRSSRRLMRKSLTQPIWPGKLKEERVTTACRTIGGHKMHIFTANIHIFHSRYRRCVLITNEFHEFC
jgi:hypothetical protein